MCYHTFILRFFWRVEGYGEPQVEKPFAKYRFDRMEFAGSLGDLGTLLPLAIGMIVLCDLRATNVIMMAGLFYIATALIFRLPIPVQPLKLVAAVAIASPEVITVPVIAASGLVFGAIMLKVNTESTTPL